MTVYELYQHCERELKKGNADKEIILCTDNGTDFLRLNYAFSSPSGNSENIEDCLADEGLSKEDVIVLN